MDHVKIGGTVKWEISCKPLGKVVHIFSYNGNKYAVVDRGLKRLVVCRIYDKLLVVR